MWSTDDLLIGGRVESRVWDLRVIFSKEQDDVGIYTSQNNGGDLSRVPTAYWSLCYFLGCQRWMRHCPSDEEFYREYAELRYGSEDGLSHVGHRVTLEMFWEQASLAEAVGLRKTLITYKSEREVFAYWDGQWGSTKSSLHQRSNRIKAILEENFYLITYCLFLF